jgi:hypothetical protein
MEYRIIVPPGIGDFSWLWSKLSTTDDKYFIEYADTGPTRLGTFLDMLPKDKITGHAINKKYRVNFNITQLQMNIVPEVPRLITYQQLQRASGCMFYVEANTHLEHGKRIEDWMPSLRTDLHYKIEGVDPCARRQDIFVVHLSSFRQQGIWDTYGVDESIEMIDMVQRKTGWMPVFIGGSYDDMARAVFEKYIDDHSAVSLVGKTEKDLTGLFNIIQQSKFFYGLVSSGMTMVANVLRTPVAAWWPRPQLPTAWADTNIPYTWFLWKDYKQDMAAVESFLQWV